MYKKVEAWAVVGKDGSLRPGIIILDTEEHPNTPLMLSRMDKGNPERAPHSVVRVEIREKRVNK